jgi:SAM-dependent methyltransferase
MTAAAAPAAAPAAVPATAPSTAHHAALAELLDPHTRWRIAGLDDWTGARCLQVGTGGGGIAGWLADRVGPDGSVVAADLAPGHRVPAHPRLTTVAYDLAGPGPWPAPLAGPFDLVVARLVLSQLPQRRTVLHQLAQRLTRGGVVLVEAWLAPPVDLQVIAAPTVAAADLYRRYQHAAGAVSDQSGTDRGWARHLHTALREEGLVDVDTAIHGRYWTGGDAGLRVVAGAAEQLRPRLLAGSAMTERQLDELGELLSDPRLVVYGHLLYSASGRRAGT